MLNAAFPVEGPDLYPENLQKEIDGVNAMVYPGVNNGVYRAGFATTQEAYAEACREVFQTLDILEKRLMTSNYLVADTLSEADIRLFTTLIRFDPVYVGHFKCNLKRIADYPALSGYLKRIREIPGIEETISIPHIKEHYYYSHDTINPTRVVPLGPEEYRG